MRILTGDCLDILPTLDAASVDAIVTDPPAGISFMGKTWDSNKGGRRQWVAWMTEVFTEVHRVLKPGGHGLVWALPRTSHWTALALEDAGFEIRDKIYHLTGQGFPKSLNVSKSLDSGKLRCQCNADMIEYRYERNLPSLLESTTEDAAESAPDVLLSGLHGGRQVQPSQEQDLRDMRAGLDSGKSVSGGAESDLLSGMQRGKNQATEIREASGPARQTPAADVRHMPAADAEASGRDALEVGSVLLGALSGGGAGQGTGQAQSQGALWLDGSEPRVLSLEDERRTESVLEGRSHVQAEQGKLHRPEVRPLPARVHGDGSEGRLCDGTSARHGADARSLPDTDGSRPPQGSRHAEQRSVEFGVVPEQRRPQTCGGCGKPRISDGLGTALKPAAEEWVLIRKPLAGTVAQNVLAHGTGGLNIDATRIGYASDADLAFTQRTSPPGAPVFTNSKYGANRPEGIVNPAGRWPSNVVLSHEPECQEVGTKRVKASQLNQNIQRSRSSSQSIGKQTDSHCSGYADPDGTETVTAWECTETCAVRLLDEQSAGVSRFYYCAKASRAERGAYNDHNTVKPLALMRWLVRLVTPSGGLVLDPFLGSGTTALACQREGFECIGIERDEHSVEIAVRRLSEGADMFTDVTVTA